MVVIFNAKGWALEHAALFFRKDRPLVEQCVRQKPSSFQWASKELKDDKPLAMLAVSGYGPCLQWCSEDLRDDGAVVKAACGRSGSALQWASDRLRADKRMVLWAVKRDGRALDYADEVMSTGIILVCTISSSELHVHVKFKLVLFDEQLTSSLHLFLPTTPLLECAQRPSELIRQSFHYFGHTFIRSRMPLHSG